MSIGQNCTAFATIPKRVKFHWKIWTLVKSESSKKSTFKLQKVKQPMLEAQEHVAGKIASVFKDKVIKPLIIFFGNSKSETNLSVEEWEI